MKNVASQCPPPHFGPASLDFHLNRPVIPLIQLQNTVLSLIQLHIVPQLELWPPISPHLASARTAPDRKLQTRFRLVPKSMTLDNLERPLRTPLHKTCVFRRPKGKFE